jgi:BlaI family penicillinase repressor
MDGPRYVFSPVVPRHSARESALRGVVRTFFDGSPAGAVAALLDMSGDKLSTQDLDEISALLKRARKEGR